MSTSPGLNKQDAARAGGFQDTRPVVVHVVYRFDTGGLENGVVNLINHMPEHAFRHVVVALTEITEFRLRVRRTDVEFIALHKPPGQGVWLFPRLYRLFRDLKPAIVHTRNLAALEVQVPAWLAGVPVRIHSEHGREGADLNDASRRHLYIRRFYSFFVTRYVALSRDLQDYLVSRVGIAPERVEQVYNGVDTGRFVPAVDRPAIAGYPFERSADHWVVGTIGRMHAVKDQALLAKSFARALEIEPALRSQLRLVMVGDGPLREQVQELLRQAGVADLAWLPGARADVISILQGLDCFVLPSLSEGISNVILEAMACGLPVIATDVGGNADLVEAERTGMLVPASDVDKLARSLLAYAENRSRAREAGRAGREVVEQRFSLEAMVSRYQEIYGKHVRSESARA